MTGGGEAMDFEALLRRFQAGSGPVPDEMLPDLAAAAFPVALRMLSEALATRNGQLLAQAVAIYRRILAAVPAADAPNRAKVAAMLGAGLQFRVEWGGGDAADLDEAVDVGRQALALIPVGHPETAAILVNLAAALRMRYDRTGASVGQRDLDDAIALLRRAAPLAPDAGVLMNLCGCLRARYDRYGDPRDLEAAIEAGRKSVDAAPPGSPLRPGLLGNLGVALAARSALGTSGAGRADLAESIGLLEDALAGMPAGSDDHATAASNLASALWLRFGTDGADTDLDRANEMLRIALAAPAKDRAAVAKIASNMSVALWGRFERSGSAEDLDAAIDTGRGAVAALTAGHVDRARHQSNLSAGLRRRFERTRVRADIDEAVDAARGAVADAGPGHPDRGRYLTNLGNVLRARFDDLEVPHDLAEAIRVLSEAADCFPAGHPDRAKPLSGLGNALRAQYGVTGVPGQLDYAITMLRAALDGVPAVSPDRAAHLFNLGKAVRDRFRLAGAAEDRAESITLLARTADTPEAAPYLRAQAARSAAELAADGQVHEAAVLAETGVRLLSAIAPRQIGRGDQEQRLADFGGLASEAAALALLDVRVGETAAERSVRALGLLEAGRGVLHGQALDTRDDLTELAVKHTDLAERYARLRGELDRGQAQWPTSPTLPGTGRIADQALQAERLAGDRYRLAREFGEIVATIRSLPGFTRFMLPPDLPELLRRAGAATVIAINASRYGSHALVLSGGTVSSLPLPDLTLSSVAAKTDLLDELLAASTYPSLRIAADDALHGLMEWLWDTVAEPVLGHLEHSLGTRQPSAPDLPPRIWWMPGGLLSRLPLHAAGYHRESAGRTVLDRTISSYTPTIRALGWARALTGAAAKPERSLIVAMPVTPGGDLGPLPNAADEARALTAILPNPTVFTSDATGEVRKRMPTRPTVLAALRDADIAHFACHAASDPASPSRSQLFLHDHESSPLTVGHLAPLRLQHACLAYLSACQTSLSMPDSLGDESIHLTSAFQLVGYPHVIGTLWPIADSFAMELATTFYTELLGAPGHIGTDSAATALRDAIRDKRDHGYGARPLLWAAYLHAGA